MTRDEFRTEVLTRDNNKCVVCGAEPTGGVHHIIERKLFTDGGYYIDNGVALCDKHHLEAEYTKERCKEYLRKGTDFVFNATNISRTLREPWISLFTEYNAYITIIFIYRPISVILQQNKQRSEKQHVPEDVIISKSKRLDIPISNEAQEVKWIF